MDLCGWSTLETRCLISIWSEESFQKKLQVVYHNRAIYEEIAKKMEANGYSRSWQQCSKKMKRMKWRYRKAKESNCKSDKENFPFYEEMNKVLGEHPSLSPANKVLDSGDVQEEADSTTSVAEVVAPSLSTPMSADTLGADKDQVEDSVSDKPSTSSSTSAKRRLTYTSDQAGPEKKTRPDPVLETFSEAVSTSQTGEDEFLQPMEDVHDDRMLDMMTPMLDGLPSSTASDQHPPPPPPMPPSHPEEQREPSPVLQPVSLAHPSPSQHNTQPLEASHLEEYSGRRRSWMRLMTLLIERIQNDWSRRRLWVVIAIYLLFKERRRRRRRRRQRRLPLAITQEDYSSTSDEYSDESSDEFSDDESSSEEDW